MKVNINDIVNVTLTAHGRRLYSRSFRYPYNMPDENGTLDIQLWELMETFSTHIHMGSEQVFEMNEIEITT